MPEVATVSARALIGRRARAVQRSGMVEWREYYKISGVIDQNWRAVLQTAEAQRSDAVRQVDQMDETKQHMLNRHGVEMDFSDGHLSGIGRNESPEELEARQGKEWRDATLLHGY
jgi:hypothetical protein